MAWLGRLWPRSLKGQMLLAVALALLLAQAVSAVLIYRAQTGQREAALLHTAAFRLLRAARDDSALPDLPDLSHGGRRSFWIDRSAASPVRPGDQRDTRSESDLRSILLDQVLTTPMLKSTAISDAGMTQQTIYELEPNQVIRKTLDRILESVNGVADEFEKVIQQAWGRKST